MRLRNSLFAFLSCTGGLYAFWGDAQSRGDAIPKENIERSSDAYLEGYIQSMIDMHYYEYQVIVSVKNRKVTLSNLPKSDLLANSIIAFVKEMPQVESVEVSKEVSEKKLKERQEYLQKNHVSGIWFPQSTIIFPPLIADPRQPVNSVNWRWDDRVVGKTAAAVSLGDDFPIFRWRNVLRWQGDLQIGIEAGIWAVFRYNNIPKWSDNDCELVNTDYFVGVPLSYGFDKYSFRMRLYHISSHLGDEFLCDRPGFCEKRVNPSFEALDLFASYQFSGGVRGYFGPGVILHSDSTYNMKRLYVEYGVEMRAFGHRFYYHKLYGSPFLAIDVQNWQVRDWNFDVTMKLGYEWSKLQGVGRKVRLYLALHHGYSYEGQFFKRKTDYGELGFSWGF